MQHDYYSKSEAAEYLGLSPGTLNVYRNLGKGPEAYKFGQGKTSHLVFRRSSLDQWLQARAAKKSKHKARPIEKARETEVRFRQRIAEIISGAPHFGMDNFRAFMAREGYATIGGIPAEKRDAFLTMLIDAAMSAEHGEG